MTWVSSHWSISCKLAILSSTLAIVSVIFLGRRLKRSRVKSTIHKVQSHASCNAAVKVIEYTHELNEVVNLAKFFMLMSVDCEWEQPGLKKIALLQISFPNGQCFIIGFRVELSTDLLAVFTDASIIKIGLGILDEDLKRFKLQWGIEPKGLVDLRFIARQLNPELTKLGLQGLVSFYLTDLALDKDWRIRASKWESEVLTERQVAYAANDVLSAMAVLLTMAFNSLNVTDFDELTLKAREMCVKYCDVPFKFKPQKEPKPFGKTPKKAYSHSTLKKPLYDNAQLEAPDGQLLCTCDSKKAMWYVSKGLGSLVSKDGSDNLVVRLNFEPAGRPACDKNYYLTAKENQCVVCGQGEDCLRKYIVPHEYRRFFPDIRRDHSSHDVLLMCLLCHQTSSKHDFDMKKQLERICDIPVELKNPQKKCEDFALKAVKSAAKALLADLKHDKIPNERKGELLKIIQDYFGADTVMNVDMLKEALCLEPRRDDHDDQDTQASLIVKHFSENEGIFALEKMWRQHFLDTMNPQFLPPNWSVDHQNKI